MKKWLFLILVIFVSSMSIPKEPLHVAIVDTGLNLNDGRFKDHLCSNGHKDFTKTSIEDIMGHGTHIAGLITKYAINTPYCLVIIKFYQEGASGIQNQANLVKSLAYAINLGVDIINFSGGGSLFDIEEYNLIKNHQNIIFSVAAGNDGLDIGPNGYYSYYPAAYNLPNVQAVGNLNREGRRAFMSNYGSVVRYWEVGTDVVSTLPNGKYGVLSGSSQSTAIHTGKLIRQLSR